MRIIKQKIVKEKRSGDEDRISITFGGCGGLHRCIGRIGAKDHRCKKDRAHRSRVQADFTEWKKDSLAVSSTDKAFIERVKNATKVLKKAGFILFATQDWHPGDHISLGHRREKL